jgi:hypothetical protein
VDFIASAEPHNWRAQVEVEGSELTVGFFKTKIEAGFAINRFCEEQGLPLQIPLLQNVTRKVFFWETFVLSLASSATQQ